VATRYRGKIKYYEVWNEPNNKKFFTGSKSKLVELARAAAATLKSVDPSIKILTPGCVGEDGALYLGEYLKLGGAKCADIVSFHFYTWGKPEASLDRIREVRKVMEENGLADRPLWNTETGWKIQANNAKGSSLVPYAIASEYLARSHLMYRALGISRFYFYAWDNKSMGLVEGDGEDKPCAAAYARIQNWLTGKAMTACKRDAKGVWRVTLMQGERRHWVIWHPDMRMTIDRPAAGVELQTIHGEVRSIAGTTQLDIGPGPILVSTSAR
jgi:hypothetical protein